MKEKNFQRRSYILRLLGLGIVLVMVTVFTTLAEDVWFQEGFSWDVPIILAIHQFGNPILDTTMRFITHTGEAGAITIAIVLAVWLVWKHRYVEAFSMVIGFSGAMALNTLLKLSFTRPRPNLFPPLVSESGFSFPSGHVTASVVVYGFLAVLLWRSKHYGWAIFSCAWILVVAISRIYLGVHYPSDTLAAIAFASLWMITVLGVHSGYLNQTKQPAPSS